MSLSGRFAEVESKEGRNSGQLSDEQKSCALPLEHLDSRAHDLLSQAIHRRFIVLCFHGG
jgi:hypothetical protein